MLKDKNKVIYKIYARKSSEAEDRQVLSIESQVDADKKLAIQRGIEIHDDLILNESKSAKNPYGRPAFEQLIKEIESGKIQGIIAWHPNRLSRNAIDAARLIDLIDKGKLIEIITSQQSFKNTPSDKFFFSMLCAQAKMDNDNKSLDVKRGLRKKYEMGYPPHLSKVGYLNDEGKKGSRKWLKDPERFDLIKQCLDMFLTGRYPVRHIQKYANEVLGLTTVQRRKEGGKPISISGMHNVLHDSFFAGFFYAKDENGDEKRYEVNELVPRMITEEQYWQMQKLLGRRGRPCPSKNITDFPYKELSKCGSCGGTVTAEHKYQLICGCKKKFSYLNKTNCPNCGIKIEEIKKPTYLHYIYYRCTKNKNPNCVEGCIREESIDESVADYFENNLQISPALRDWCINNFEQILDNEKDNELVIKKSWKIEQDEKKKQKDELIIMRAKGLIKEDDFSRIAAGFDSDIEKAEKMLSGFGGTYTDSLEKAKKMFDLAVGIGEIFRKGGFKEKSEALSEICSNLKIKDKKVQIYEQKAFSILMNGLLGEKAQNKAFEPKEYAEYTNETGDFSPVSPKFVAMLRR